MNSVSLESYGLYGDRSHAFVDNTKKGWSRYITARQFPEMLSYKAELDMQLSGIEVPQVKVTCPDGRIQAWDEHLLSDIQMLSDHKVSMERYNLNSQEQLAVDEGSILMITNRSLEKLAELLGKSVDERRLRANLLLSFYDDVNVSDADFIGKNIKIGNAELSIKSMCKRCSMINIDPDNLERDPTFLKKIHESMNLSFGMYADVLTLGTVHVGDQVFFRKDGYL
ncbi:MOSC domain protein [compost metagenome]